MAYEGLGLNRIEVAKPRRTATLSTAPHGKVWRVNVTSSDRMSGLKNRHRVARRRRSAFWGAAYNRQKFFYI